jgi:glycosyltransferase involved in cell wall biosynthesis
MKVAVLFDNFGPYHIARLKVASAVADVSAVQFAGDSSNYQWQRAGAVGLKIFTLNPSGTSWEMTHSEFRSRLFGVLNQVLPDVVFVPGWATPGPLLALQWCLQKSIPVVMMSESTAWDSPRVFLRESVKRFIVSLASAALVGGKPQRDYMIQLGMPQKCVFTGYNIVDNEYFTSESDRWRQSGNSLDQPYFLASNRFIAKKNLFFLLDAYAAYVKQTSMEKSLPLWPIVLLGDGELRESLFQHARSLGLDLDFSAPWEVSERDGDRGRVFFPGFRQVNELPRFYAGAGAFVHASLSEQWGLVVNEAMASKLPVLVSKNCGCAIDLVREGENGYTFVALRPESLTQLLLKISKMDLSSRKKMGECGCAIISGWGANHFADGFQCAAKEALEAPPKRSRLLANALLTVFCKRLLA